MKSYFIFAIVLTAAYIVYYAVIIVHDLYGKKGTGKMQEEVFDLGEPDDEESVAVTENETGFEVGSNAYETETGETRTAESQSGGTDGRERALPLGRTHGRGDVPCDGRRRPDGLPPRNGVETPQRTIVRCRRRPGYYAYYALFPVRR